MKPVRFGSAIQMPVSLFPAASLVHFLGNPIPESVGTQGKGCKEQPLEKPASPKLSNQTNSSIMPLGL